jgi:hypothetical protein
LCSNLTFKQNQAERDRRRREYVESEAARLAGEFRVAGTGGGGGGKKGGVGSGRRMTPSPTGGMGDDNDQEQDNDHLQSSPGATKRYFEVNLLEN